MLETDVDAADAITFETVTTVTKGGRTKTKRVKISLDDPPVIPQTSEAGPSSQPLENFPINMDMEEPFFDEAPFPEPTRSKVRSETLFYFCHISMIFKTQKDYILEFVENIEPFLAALLSREVLPPEQSKCSHCTRGSWAVWRCQDCALGIPTCRNCMRRNHQHNPFHRIQRWTGTYFRVADLWEVGAYLLVPHHQGEALCDALTIQREFLEKFECQKDVEEQERLGRLGTARQAAPYASQNTAGSHTAPHTSGYHHTDPDDMDWEPTPDQRTQGEDALEDEVFERYLNSLHRGQQMSDEDDKEGENDLGEYAEADDDAVIADSDADIIIPQYLPEQIHGDAEEMPHSDAFNNAYVRIVHTNGLHHLAMVSCRCRGTHSLPCDLIASRLLPTSFKNIRTLFSAQVLDYFRLCNLEMKASAYQFYHLLRRLTLPTAPAEVADLYNEFRRMSRLWRWMKKLKWAGYGHNGKSPMDVGRGELANYCAACPQPGINLPENWKEDVNRSELLH